MIDSDLIKKLQKMRQIKPDPDWALFCRQELIQRFNDSTIQRFSSSTINRWLINSINPINQFIFAAFRLSPAKATVTATIMILMAVGLVFNLSQNASPESALYSLKLVSEKAALKAVPGDENKLSLHTKFAERRVKEISALSRNAEINTEVLFPVLNEYKNQLASVEEILDAAIKEGNGNAVKFAEKVTKEAEKYQATLSAASPDQLEEAIAFTEDTNLKALTVLSSQTDGSKEFADKLKEILEGKIVAIKASLEDIDDENVSDQVKTLLQEAEKLLEKGDLEGALVQLSAAEGILER